MLLVSIKLVKPKNWNILSWIFSYRQNLTSYCLRILGILIVVCDVDENTYNQIKGKRNV